MSSHRGATWRRRGCEQLAVRQSEASEGGGAGAEAQRPPSGSRVVSAYMCFRRGAEASQRRGRASHRFTSSCFFVIVSCRRVSVRVGCEACPQPMIRALFSPFCTFVCLPLYLSPCVNEVVVCKQNDSLSISTIPLGLALPNHPSPLRSGLRSACSMALCLSALPALWLCGAALVPRGPDAARPV